MKSTLLVLEDLKPPTLRVTFYDSPVNEVESLDTVGSLCEELTVAQARIAAANLPSDSVTWRSCWNCNAAHIHLKSVTLLNCFACGRWFYKGVDITEG